MDDEIYMAELYAERDRLDPSFEHCIRLLNREIDVAKAGKAKPAEQVHLSEKVFVPAKDFPGYNFVGRLLGPRGLTLKRMQSETCCRLTIMGRGSIREPNKEEDLRTSGDPKYEHLNDELHVLVEAKGGENIAAARLAAGVAEVRKMLIPGDANDQIRGEQLRELALLNGLRDRDEILARVDSDQFGVASAGSRSTVAAPRNPQQGPAPRPVADVYSNASRSPEYTPVVMVPQASFERVAGGPAGYSAQVPAFEAAYVEQSTRSRRYGGGNDFLSDKAATLQMVHIARQNGAGILSAADTWGRVAQPRPVKRFHPYATPTGHY